jgi:hypothetical protein
MILLDNFVKLPLIFVLITKKSHVSGSRLYRSITLVTKRILPGVAVLNT